VGRGVRVFWWRLVTELPHFYNSTQDDMRDFCKELRDDNFIDGGTRAVFFELVLLSPSESHFAIASMVSETDTATIFCLLTAWHVEANVSIVVTAVAGVLLIRPHCGVHQYQLVPPVPQPGQSKPIPWLCDTGSVCSSGCHLVFLQRATSGTAAQLE